MWGERGATNIGYMKAASAERAVVGRCRLWMARRRPIKRANVIA